ncbi:MAG: glycosyltransferase [Acetobacteraceae bacterium]|nr:glycosyltransferase [Acetobacteraceae bacterium]
MRHLIISRELPPASYAPGGIGTYVANIARLLAQGGDTVHLIGERWEGAPEPLTVMGDGRIIVHRVGPEDIPERLSQRETARALRELEGLRETVFPTLWFAWSAALLAERLAEQEGIDLIEAQDWEAPLYYFLLRRSLGLGPERQPPCLVHLHSPSAFIHRYNGPAERPPWLTTIKRMEAFCIESADALVCPSRRMAVEAVAHFRLARESIEVIPLPVGFTPVVDRDESVWSHGSICFIGRLEPRKGVIEWVEAARRVALEEPSVHFDFVGADLGLQKALLERVGKGLAPRFRFHGAKPRAELVRYLARARAGVVPSRWENFPNVCIEAMASGLPVIATPFGGIAEMVDDGRTGWLTADTDVAGMIDSLADALRRCLATPPRQAAAMGAAAAEAIRRYCDNDVIAKAHQRLRIRVAGNGPVRTARTPVASSSLGANIVVRADTVASAGEVLRSLRVQTAPPLAVALVVARTADEEELAALGLAGPDLVVQHAPSAFGVQAWNLGFARLAAHPAPGFWLFLDEHDRLEPDCLEKMAAVLSNRSDVGVVSPWTDRIGAGGRFDARPSPTRESQLTGNDICPAAGFRAQAIGAAPPFSPGVPREHDVWGLANAAIARGWAAVTLPSLLAEREAAPTRPSYLSATALRALRAQALAVFDSDEYRLALQIIDDYVPLDNQPPAPAPQGYRRRLLGVLETLLLRPRYALHRCLSMLPGLPLAKGTGR